MDQRESSESDRRTCHDDGASPDLLACVPAGFKFVEKARPRKTEQSLTTNYGGVCLLYDASLHARLLQLPAQVPDIRDRRRVLPSCCLQSRHRCRLQTGPQSVTQTAAFFTDCSDLLQRLTVYSSTCLSL